MLNITPINPFGALVSVSEKRFAKISDLCADELTQLLFENKILIFRGFEQMPDGEYIEFCKSFGDLMLWDFGSVLNVRMEQDPKNHIFSKGRVELHWDGAFAPCTPRINAFQCVMSSANGFGGETLFVDTTRILNDITEEEMREWSNIVLTYSTEKKAHYGGEIVVNFIDSHPHCEHKIIRFIEVDNEDNMEVNPVGFRVEGLARGCDEKYFLNMITQKMYSKRYMYRHRWSTGDYMLIDNNSVLHGRARVEGNVNRHLKRIHIL